MADVGDCDFIDVKSRGMTLRDWFAGMALQGMLAYGLGSSYRDDQIVDTAYRRADVMLRRRGIRNDGES
jgi:hypothetical protein